MEFIWWIGAFKAYIFSYNPQKYTRDKFYYPIHENSPLKINSLYST